MIESNKVSLSDSLSITYNAVSLSSVLYQALESGINIIIDDESNAEKYLLLKNLIILCYQNLTSYCHNMLSKCFKEEFIIDEKKSTKYINKNLLITTVVVLYVIIDLIRYFNIVTQLTGNVLYVLIGSFSILYSITKGYRPAKINCNFVLFIHYLDS